MGDEPSNLAAPGAAAYAEQQTAQAQSDSTASTKAAGGAPTMFFYVWTTLYIFILYQIGGPRSGENSFGSTKMYTAGYILITIVSQYLFNVGETKIHCGEPQWSNALFITVVPWIAVFGIVNLMLIVFPGWLSPFANTIGYGVAKLMGLDKVMREVFRPPSTEGATQSEDTVQRALAEVTTDPSLLFNQMPLDSAKFTTFRANTTTLQSQSALEIEWEKLHRLVWAKELTAWYVWYLLAGTLCVRMGISYMANSTCELSAATRQKIHDDYLASEAKALKGPGRQHIDQ